MAKDHMSPEERLLALIRGKHKKPQANEPGAPAPKDAPEGTAAQPKTRKAKGFHAGAGFRPSALGHRLLEPATLRALNRYLVLLTIMIGLYLIVDIFFAKPDMDKAPQDVKKSDSQAGASSGGPKAVNPAIRDYSYYSSDISVKNIFGPAPSEEGPDQQVMAAPEEVASTLGLVGIIAGDNPQAVIEDKKAQKTYYLIKGQSFNGLTVEEVTEGKVVLDYQGKKIALLL